MNDIKGLWLSLKRHPWRALGQMFLAFSVQWTVVESFDHFLPVLDVKGAGALWVVIVLSFCWAIVHAWKPIRVEWRIPNSNTTIEILFGDLFEQDGLRAISVNEFFDSAIGRPVSSRSLHGIFLTRCFGGHPESFDKQVDAQLGPLNVAEVQRKEGKRRRYPIGTTVLMDVSSDQYILVALSCTDTETHKASADVGMLWTALEALLRRARTECGGRHLNLPLVGSGLAGVGLPTRDILNLIILCTIAETKTRHVTQRIRVVLHSDRFDEIDLRVFKSNWEK
jgi:hypothetical protein